MGEPYALRGARTVRRQIVELAAIEPTSVM